ncbi:MAG: S8 family serine peptidase, partial [Bacteroidota bacterium]
HSNLYHLAKYVGQAPKKRFAIHNELLPEMITRDDHKINVEIVFGEDTSKKIDRKLLQRINANVHLTWKNRASCWLRTDELLDVARKLPEEYVMLPVYEPCTDNQGPGLMNSADYITGGADGTGINIAIMDGGFDTLSEAMLVGVVPNNFGALYNWSGGGGSVEVGSVHGTGCLENAFDHAPNATYFIHRVANATDMGVAVDQAILDGVNIISHSASRYNTGWGDDTGPACSAVQDAVDAGILFITSSGNRHGTHWEGEYKDDDNDDRHEWNANDESNNFTVNPDGSVRVRLQWNASSALDCYDVFLFDANTDTIITGSNSTVAYEIFNWTNPSSVISRNVYLVVTKGTSNLASPTFELFNHETGNTDLQYASADGSTASPSNCSDPNVISVGAVGRTQYNSASGSDGIIRNYSSRGPTNDGAQTLDLIGPDGTTTWAYGGGFVGTSCSTPNVAGAAAAFWSANPTLTATGVRQILLRKAALYKDWGDNGYDHVYGHGGLELYDHFDVIRYILSTSGNNAGNSERAYKNMQQADADAPNNARIVFLGGIYQQPPPNFIFTKPLIYVSAVLDSRVQ